MTNEEKAREIASSLWSGNEMNGEIIRGIAILAALKMAEWKDEENKINNAHLNMLFEALDKLYKKKYENESILYTGSQTDVYLQMINNLIEGE